MLLVESNAVVYNFGIDTIGQRILALNDITIFIETGSACNVPAVVRWHCYGAGVQ